LVTSKQGNLEEANEMETLQPPNPGIVLRDLLKEKSIDPKEFAIRLGMHEASLNELLEGNGHIDASLSAYLVGLLGQDHAEEYWLFMQRHYDSWIKPHP
jgi:addiction module HigA family antidote